MKKKRPNRILSGDFLLTKEWIQIIKSLRFNGEIPTTKPDNKACVVGLNKQDYNKIDSSKFLDLGSTTYNDNTAKIESRIPGRVLQLKKENLISPLVYDAIRRTGSQQPRMYGLLKIHKKDVPLRPIFVNDRFSQASTG